MIALFVKDAVQNMEKHSKDLQNESTQHMVTTRQSYLRYYFHSHADIKMKLCMVVQEKELQHQLVLLGATAAEFVHIQR